MRSNRSRGASSADQQPREIRDLQEFDATKVFMTIVDADPGGCPSARFFEGMSVLFLIHDATPLNSYNSGRLTVV